MLPLLAVPILGRVRTRADKHKPHFYSFECGVPVAAERNASYGHCLRVSFDGGVSDIWVFALCFARDGAVRWGEIPSLLQRNTLILNRTYR